LQGEAPARSNRGSKENRFVVEAESGFPVDHRTQSPCSSPSSGKDHAGFRPEQRVRSAKVLPNGRGRDRSVRNMPAGMLVTIVVPVIPTPIGPEQILQIGKSLQIGKADVVAIGQGIPQQSELAGSVLPQS